MKTIKTLALSILFTTSALAQVKIGDNPNSINVNSMLELESTNKGFLPPRVALSSINTTSPLTATTPTGMMVYSSGGAVTDGYYNWNGTKWVSFAAATRNNYVLVKSASDLPTASGGVITLVANTEYEINGAIYTTNKIDMNGCTIHGNDAVNDRLVYTGTGELFTGANGGSLRFLTLVAPGGKVFNLDAAGAAKNLVVTNCYIASSASVGTVKGFGGAVYFQTIAYQNNLTGIIYEDDKNVIVTFTLWDVNNGNTYEKNGTFSNSWEVESFGIETQKDDVSSGNIYLTSTVQTTFVSSNTATKVQCNTQAASLYRVTSPSNNRMTYTGGKTRRFQVIGSLSLSSAAVNKTFTFYVAKNGVIQPESKQTLKMENNSDKGSLTLSCTLPLSTNDYIEVWVENDLDNTAMTVESLNFSMK
ncbi:MAG: hypothetical protein K0S32_1859 [Bacteroidetes bacterium]|nr:hypothetical protein [Bacteroidota bacterium]